MVQQVTNTREGRRRFAHRVAVRSLLALGTIITFLGVAFVIAAWTEDISIDRDIGGADAEVLAVDFSKTLVRFYTADGAEHVPQVGVLYPSGLAKGDVVRVEYRQDNPEQVRVAGRGAFITLLPVGLTLVGVWAVLVPAVWWVRRRV